MFDVGTLELRTLALSRFFRSTFVTSNLELRTSMLSVFDVQNLEPRTSNLG